MTDAHIETDETTLEQRAAKAAILLANALHFHGFKGKPAGEGLWPALELLGPGHVHDLLHGTYKPMDPDTGRAYE